MNKEDFVKFRITDLLKNKDKYDFPMFIRILRTYHGIQRKHVSKDINIPETRLFYLEYGRFRRPPPDHEIEILSEYYGVPYDVLKDKSEEFIRDGKGRNQWEK